jgi:hypothetical protein
MSLLLNTNTTTIFPTLMAWVDDYLDAIGTQMASGLAMRLEIQKKAGNKFDVRRLSGADLTAGLVTAEMQGHPPVPEVKAVESDIERILSLSKEWNEPVADVLAWKRARIRLLFDNENAPDVALICLRQLLDGVPNIHWPVKG